MDTYLIVARIKDGKGDPAKTGVVLSTKDAPSPEDAMNEWAKHLVSDYANPVISEWDNPAEKRVNMAMAILEAEIGPNQIVIYKAAGDESGETWTMTPEGLEF